MYRYFMPAACITVSLLGSNLPQHNHKPLTRETIEDTARNKPIAQLHELIVDSPGNAITKINDPELKDLNPFLFFTCLPKELRMNTLTQNFFNNDNNDAAEKFESAPCVIAFCLLGEYQQKPHPYTLLSPRFIFMLYPDQVKVIAKIEGQQLQAAATAVLAGPVAAQPWYIIPKPNTYANLTYDEVQILKKVPDQIIEQSPINQQIVGYSGSYKAPFGLTKNIIKYSKTSFETQTIICLFSGLLSVPNIIIQYCREPQESISNFSDLYWCAPGVFLRLILPIISTYYRANIAMNMIVDSALIIGSSFYKKSALAPLLWRASIFKPLFCTTFCIGSFIAGANWRNSYPNSYTIESKKKKQTANPCILL